VKFGTKILLTGILLTVAGIFVVPYLFIMPLFESKYPEVTFKAPGVGTIEIIAPGRYYLWNDYQTFYDGQTYNNSKRLPSGTRIRIVNEESGKEIPFVADSSISLSVGNKAQNSVGYVEVSDGKSLKIEVSQNSEDRILTFAKSRFMDILGTLITTGIFASILAFSGIGMMIWGLIRMSAGEEPVIEEC